MCVTASATAAVTLVGLATSAAATTQAAGSHPHPAYQGPIDNAIGPPTVRPIGDATVAALQVALHARRLQPGPIDGLMGPRTAGAIRRLQRRARLPVDGVVDSGTRAALGPLGRHSLGSRVLAFGAVGWDVAALQFLLAWHGFPSGVFDGELGNHTATAIRRFQRWAGLPEDGRAGPATLAALRARPAVSPITLAWPLLTRLGDPFGPRGARFHSGIDLPAPAGMGVVAAGPGRVTWAGRRAGGWGLLVTIAHSKGVRSMYAHLSRVDVRVGERVTTGLQIGLVGATGHATGPHLHFELRLRGAAIDPLTALR
jgi:peptidoglycan hydrolase-like protein with peptidoglycan-binding domain